MPRKAMFLTSAESKKFPPQSIVAECGENSRISHNTSQTAKNKRRGWLGLFGHVFCDWLRHEKKATMSLHVTELF